MNNENYKEIHPEPDDYCQPVSMLEIDDPFLLSNDGAPVLYGTLVQKDAAKAACGTDRGFFCYLGGDGLTRWAGPFLLCDNPIDAREFSCPRLVRANGGWLLFGKFRAEDHRGIVIFFSENPLGKFRFVSAFRLDADFAPFADRDGKISLICTEGNALVRRKLSENLLNLSAPEVLLDKIKPAGAPAILPESGDNPVIVLPAENGLILVTASGEKGQLKWKSSKIGRRPAVESCSGCTGPSGENLLVCGLNHGFALLRYQLKKGRLSIKDAVLPYTEREIRAAQTGGEPENPGKKTKPGKGFHLNVNPGAIAAVTIALISAGIGILMGLTAGKRDK